ncbi:META domain-containing protein [Novosphingobium ginsenosidimutans]|uniref:META domain-containing protein n=1 Tax=Novosphingobium ginsenosidimutans TaxID=1176536 RepID=A0A5B8S829_9SPHN|nr:META domain-containing protein [Novosphingobium ginsenosidimutans]QEA17308.1 META domain-containing protein [Novosphingobium ginsenosidimutans]
MLRQALLAALPLLAACATPQTGAEPKPASGPDRPLTSWTFVSIDGQKPVSNRAELRIFEKRIAATVGCNGLGGDLQLINGQMKVGPIISTQMYCEGLMEQERAVAELLGASPAFFVENGRMGIKSGKHVAELVRKAD